MLGFSCVHAKLYAESIWAKTVAIYLAKYDSEKGIIFLTLIFLGCSFALNYQYEGSSVGPLSWFFVILPVAFFLQVLSFYLLRPYFVLIWCVAMLGGLIFTLVG